MLEDEDMQFHLAPSPKKRAKNEETDQDVCIICQKKNNNLVSGTGKGKNTLIMYASRAKDDVHRRLQTLGVLEKNVALRNIAYVTKTNK